MTMGVHEPGHDDGVAGVDHRGITRPKRGADLGDGLAVDEDVGSRWLPMAWLMLRTQPPLMSVLVTWLFQDAGHHGRCT